MGLNNI